MTQLPEGEAASSVNRVSTTKRALLKAGWIAPVILAVDLPRSGFAANISGGQGTSGNGGSGNSGSGNRGSSNSGPGSSDQNCRRGPN